MASDRNNGITVVLDGTNYYDWSHLIQNFLKGQKLWKYVASKINPLDTKDTKYEEWDSDLGKINS